MTARSTRLRILTIASGQLDKPGGTELYQLEVCRELTRRGHTLSVLFHEPGALIDEWRAIAEHCAPSGWRPESRNPVRLAAGLVRGRRGLSTSLTSVTYIHHTSDAIPAWILGRGRPLVCHLHMLYFGEVTLPFRIGLRQITAFIANSAATASSWESSPSGRKQTFVVPNGVDTGRFHPVGDAMARSAIRERYGISKDSFVVVFAGRATPGKGVRVAARAVAQLAGSDSGSTVLVVVGSADRAFIDDLGADAPSADLRYLGWLPDITEILQMADVLVLPSLAPEGFGSVVLEAMACGTPAVASDIGGLGEVLTGEFAGFLFPPGDVDELARRLRMVRHRLLTDPELAHRCRNYVVDRFSLTGAVDRVEEILVSTAVTRGA